MSGMIGWFVRNPVAANLLMCLLAFGGLVTLPGIPQEEFHFCLTGCIVDEIVTGSERRWRGPGRIEIARRWRKLAEAALHSRRTRDVVSL